MSEKPKPTKSQIAGHRVATRGMDKSAVGRARQLMKPRTPEQRPLRYQKLCVTCGRRRTGTFPICDVCSRARDS